MGLSIAGADMGGRLASLDVFGLIFEAGPIVKLVLLLLAVMSVGSWAIIAYKWRELARAVQDSEAFLEVYHEDSFSAAFEAARHLERSPLAALFLTGCAEMTRSSRSSAQGVPPDLDPVRVQAVGRQLVWAAAREVQRLERGLSFLATTGSSAPFIGLFGTVVGIIQAFHGIAQAGSASLAVVAPGIAEALVATAAGLLAAIPATIFFNHFVTRMEVISTSIDLFTTEFESDLGQLGQKQAPRSAARSPGTWASGE